MTVSENTLTVLKQTIGEHRPPSAFVAQPTGARLVNILQSTGWGRTRKRMSIEEVLHLSSVTVCLDVLSQDIAKTTFRMYESLPGGGKREVEADEHEVANLLKTEPNRHHTWYEFFQMTILHLGLVQNAFIAKRQTASGEIKELIPCMPARTVILAIEPSPSVPLGMYAYEVSRFTPHEKIQLAGLPQYFLEDEFIHLRGRMFDGLAGYSNLEAGAKSFGLSDALMEYQIRLYENDAQMRGVFEMGKESGDALSDEAFQRLRDQIAEAYGKFRTENMPIILEEGMTFKDVAMNAQQAEIVKQTDSAILNVARTFRMPPHKIMHLVNVKYENMETLEKSYVNDVLIPYCRPIEQRFARSLLSKEDRARYFFEFDRTEMLLNDHEKLAEVVKVLLQNGSMEIDEARSRFGINPLPNNAGKTRLIPSTYTLIDSKSNEPIISAGAQPAGGSESEEQDEEDADKKKKSASATAENVVEFPSIAGER